MFSEIKINGMTLPAPDEDPEFENKKITTEYETEAGTTQVSVRRASKLKLSGKWTLTGRWIEQSVPGQMTIQFPFPASFLQKLK